MRIQLQQKEAPKFHPSCCCASLADTGKQRRQLSQPAVLPVSFPTLAPVCLKFNSILSRATLARFVRTLQARSSAPSDQILFQHISFFSSGSDLKKSSLPFFTENFFWPFPPWFSKTEKNRKIPIKIPKQSVPRNPMMRELLQNLVWG